MFGENKELGVSGLVQVSCKHIISMVLRANKKLTSALFETTDLTFAERKFTKSLGGKVEVIGDRCLLL